MTPNEARETLEREPRPESWADLLVDLNVKPQIGSGGLLPSPLADTPDVTPSKAWELEMAQFEAFADNKTHRKRDFKANHINEAEMAAVLKRKDPAWQLALSRYP